MSEQSSSEEFHGNVVRTWWNDRTPYARTVMVLSAVGVFLLVIVLAAFSGGSSDTSSSSGNSTDSGFLANVHHRAGISKYSDATLIQGAHWVCSQRTSGYSESAVVDSEYRDTILGFYDSGYMVGASEAAYCPQYSEQ